MISGVCVAFHAGRAVASVSFVLLTSLWARRRSRRIFRRALRRAGLSEAEVAAFVSRYNTAIGLRNLMGVLSRTSTGRRRR